MEGNEPASVAWWGAAWCGMTCRSHLVHLLAVGTLRIVLQLVLLHLRVRGALPHARVQAQT